MNNTAARVAATLTGEETPAKRCWFFHNWSKWKRIDEGDVLRPRYVGDLYKVGTWWLQCRVCLDCGFEQRLRKSETSSS